MRTTSRPIVGTLLALALLGALGCVHRPPNQPLARYDPDYGYRFTNPGQFREPGDVARLATGIFFYIGGGEITFYTFLGVHGLVGVYRLIGHLRHSHVWLSYGRVGYLLISPAQHQIHHSALEKHWGRNCGFALAIWDWMFGTLYVPKEREYFPMGLGDGSEASWHGVKAMYIKPLVGAARLLFGGGGQPPTAVADGPSPS